jgi:hypothetical protein
MTRQWTRRSFLKTLAAGAVLPPTALAQSGASSPGANAPSFAQEVLKARFDYLSKNGNSSCSASFLRSIKSMPDDARLRGSCCSPMSLHRYGEQIEGLRKFKAAAGQNLPEIPDDPYDIEAALAKKLLSYYDMKLSPQEQESYDYAMKNSDEKGPCCCRCWRWQVYGGLGKFAIRSHGFSGEQVAKLWDLSDGCGGEAEHVGHPG